MNSLPDDEQRLKAILVQAAPVLPDDGFSARVVSALPRKATVHSSSARLILCATGALAGAALAWRHGTTPQALALAAGQLRDSFAGSSGGIAEPAMVVALAVAGISLLYAFKPGLRLVRRF